MKMNEAIAGITFLLLLVLSPDGASPREPRRHAPNALPGVLPEMLSAGYWAALHDDADDVIMTPEEIERFNAAIRNREGAPERFEGPLRRPILPLSLPRTMPGDSLRVILESNREKLMNPDELYGSRDFYDDRNAVYNDDMKRRIVDRMNIDGIPDLITRRFGIIVRHALVRQYPTHTPGYHDTKTVLDRFQITDLCIGNPVSILHESAHGDFLYVESPIARGWIAAESIAVGSRAGIRELVDDPDFLMATGDKIPVYGDPAFRNFSRYFYFSATLPVAGRHEFGTIVRMPYRKIDGSLGIANGYVKPDADVHFGRLPYTKRNVLTQIFKLLNTPYGWHGQDNKRDCIGVQRVLFRCFGIQTGRFIWEASDNQVLIDPGLSTEEKMERVRKIESVITVASAPGHVVLYLGEGHNGMLYFMHQGGWGYKDENGEYLIVNRVSINAATHSWYHIDTPNRYTIMRFK